MSANGISTLPTKEDKQIAKLDLSEQKRTTTGNPRNVYNISMLPTRYSGDEIVDNENVGGLIQGRPWVSLEAGIYRSVYSGYFADNVAFFTTPTSAGVVTDIYDTAGEIAEITSIQYTGYFLAKTTGTYTFYSSSDDASFVWVGPFAIKGFTTDNATVKNPGLHGPVETSGTVDLVAGGYYPIRVQYGNNGSAGVLDVSYSNSTVAKTRLSGDVLWYNSVTNGI